MKSLDADILLYSTNSSCPEHAQARSVVEEMLAEPAEWILAEQVLWEYYRLLRDPAILERPLSAREAADRLEFFHDRAGCLHCPPAAGLWRPVLERLRDPQFPARRTFHLLLAETLRANAVDTFYTRNRDAFADLGCFTVIDPIDPPRDAMQSDAEAGRFRHAP